MATMDEDIRYKTLHIKYIEGRGKCIIFTQPERKGVYDAMDFTANEEMLDILISSAEDREIDMDTKFLKHAKRKLLSNDSIKSKT